MTSAFLDTGILVYAFAADERRTPVARTLVQQGFSISVQSLNEFANALRRQHGFHGPELERALKAIETFAGPILPLTVALHRTGLRLAHRHGFSIYGSMIVAAALETGCDVLYSEDMHHGLVVDGRLTITNPFRG